MVDLNELYGTVTDGGGGYTATNPANVNDGNPATSSQIHPNNVGAVPPCYLVSDLGAPRPVGGFTLYANLQCNEPHDFGWLTFQYSDDGSTWVEANATMDSFDAAPGIQTSEWSLPAVQTRTYWRITYDSDPYGGFNCGSYVYTWAITEGDEPDPDPDTDPPDYEAPEPGGAIVEIYVTDPDGYRWDVAEWDEATWADSDWVSITEWVIYVDLTWGTDRPDAGILADQVAGAWVLETHDPDRVLDPGNPDSQFYPQLIPDLPIRVNHGTGKTVRTGIVTNLWYYHATDGGRIAATDDVSTAQRATVPPGTALSDTFIERVEEAIDAAGVTLHVSFGSDSALMDAPLAPVDEDATRSVWKVIADAAREVLAVPWVDRHGHLRLTSWDTDTDKGMVVGSDTMLELVSWVSYDGLYSVIRATDEADVEHEARAVPLPAYGERVYSRSEPTINAAAWAARVLADRRGAILRYRPGTIRPWTAAQNDALVDMETMDIVTIEYPETDPPITVRARVLGVRLRVTDQTKRYPEVLTRWEWSLLTTIVPPAPLIEDGSDPVEYLYNDDDPTDLLYPDGVTMP